MENRLRDDEEVQQCLSRILALACLPANEIEAAYFELLHTLSERCIRDQLSEESSIFF